MSFKFNLLFVVFIVKFCEIISCPVYLTIGLNRKHYNNAALIVNWGPCEPTQIPTWIGVYDVNPFYSQKKPVHYENIENRKDGRIETQIKIGKLALPHKWNVSNESPAEFPEETYSKCLKYFIVAYNETNHVQTFDCLKIQPQWMSDLPNNADISLKNLYIPGTHCSGCYLSKTNGRKSVLKRFGFKQFFDIWTQLVFGVRFLQFQVGYFEPINDPDGVYDFSELLNDTTRNFWVMSENYKVARIYPMLQDIKKFVELSKEVVIVDFRGFPMGFFNKPERHSEFMKIIYDVLGDVAIVRDGNINSYDLTIKEMRMKQKYLLITYNYQESTETEHSSILWPSWKLHSTEYLKTEEYAVYMKNVFVPKVRKASKNDGEIDGDKIGWIFEGIQGVGGSIEPHKNISPTRENAEKINTKIISWLGGPWSRSANVVLLDFIMSTNLIDIAIYTNTFKQPGVQKDLAIIGL